MSNGGFADGRFAALDTIDPVFMVFLAGVEAGVAGFQRLFENLIRPAADDAAIDAATTLEELKAVRSEVMKRRAR